LIAVVNQAANLSLTRWRLGVGALALAFGLAACGGGDSSVASANTAPPDAATIEAAASGELAPEAAAEVNLPLLQPAETVIDFEVLDVADGSISSLGEAVVGDRPVLLWFFSPH